SCMRIELPPLRVPLSRGFFEFLDLPDEAVALSVPLLKVFLELTLKIANLGIHFRRILLRDRTAHNLCSAPKFDHLARHLQPFLFPLRLCPEKSLFKLGFFFSDPIQLDLELFLDRLSHPQWI